MLRGVYAELVEALRMTGEGLSMTYREFVK
jgi:hypothetical protein